MTAGHEIKLAAVDSLPADRHPLSVYRAGLASAHSRDAAEQAARKGLGLLLGHEVTDEQAYSFPWGSLRYQHVVAIRQRLVEAGYAPSTVNQHIALLKGVCREAWRLGHLDAEQHARIADVKGVKASRLPAGRALSAGELHALFRACDGSPSGRRDAALLGALYGAGLRRGEAVALQVSDHDPEAGTLRVLGKGNRERLAHLPSGAMDALAEWLALRGESEGSIFCNVPCGGPAKPDRPISADAVGEAVARRARQAGLDRVTAHDLRRTWIGDLLDLGADLASVQGLAGHASPTTTTGYDRRPEEARRRAASLLHVPVARKAEGGPEKS